MISRNLPCLMPAFLFLSGNLPAAEPTPPAEAESGVYFHKKTYRTEALPAFAAVRSLLPEPVIPSHPEWGAMYWKCWQLAFAHLRQPPKGSPLVSNWLDEAFSPNIFQWDTCFMMMFARYGHYQFPGDPVPRQLLLSSASQRFHLPRVSRGGRRGRTL